VGEGVGVGSASDIAKLHARLIPIRIMRSRGRIFVDLLILVSLSDVGFYELGFLRMV
jgi:hypothetical protein